MYGATLYRGWSGIFVSNKSTIEFGNCAKGSGYVWNGSRSTPLWKPVLLLNPIGTVMLGMICTSQNLSLVLRCLGFDPSRWVDIPTYSRIFCWGKKNPHSPQISGNIRPVPGYGSAERWIWSQLRWQGAQSLRGGVALRSLGRGPGGARRSPGVSSVSSWVPEIHERHGGLP